jgi:putative RecB family exonuclease
MVKYRSFSQLKEYSPKHNGCPYRYYLHRMERAWERPAAWLPQGVAVHEAAEMWERSGREMSVEDAQAIFRKSYVENTNKMLADTPNMEYWFRSGPYDGETDIARRFEVGTEQVEKYIRYYTEQHPEQVIWITPNGEPAIELDLTVKLGDVEVRAKIDSVVVEADGEPTVRDNKTGAKPDGPAQLKTYGVMVEKATGVPMTRGDYWMGKTGRPSRRHDLTKVSEQEVVDEFGELDAAIRAEKFDPAPDPDKCERCTVALSCRFRAQ